MARTKPRPSCAQIRASRRDAGRLSVVIPPVNRRATISRASGTVVMPTSNSVSASGEGPRIAPNDGRALLVHGANRPRHASGQWRAPNSISVSSSALRSRLVAGDQQCRRHGIRATFPARHGPPTVSELRPPRCAPGSSQVTNSAGGTAECRRPVHWPYPGPPQAPRAGWHARSLARRVPKFVRPAGTRGVYPSLSRL
jgi:hypothetical protein